MNTKDFPKTSDIILNYENGWLDIHLNNVENRNALSTKATARLLQTLMLGDLLDRQATLNITKLLFRSLDLAKRKS